MAMGTAAMEALVMAGVTSGPAVAAGGIAAAGAGLGLVAGVGAGIQRQFFDEGYHAAGQSVPPAAPAPSAPASTGFTSPRMGTLPRPLGQQSAAERQARAAQESALEAAQAAAIPRRAQHD